MCKTGIGLTPWHPYLDTSTWRFPVHSWDCDDVSQIMVYNLVLDSDHIVIVGSYPYVTLGHGLTGEVVGHEFFGTHRVIHNLQKLPGWDKGRVHVNQVIRKGSVIGFA